MFKVVSFYLFVFKMSFCNFGIIFIYFIFISLHFMFLLYFYFILLFISVFYCFILFGLKAHFESNPSPF